MAGFMAQLQRYVRSCADSTPAQVAAYFKTGHGQYAQHDRFLGITVPTLRKIAHQLLDLTLVDVALLLASPFNEERLLALIILVQQYQLAAAAQQENIYQFYHNNLDYINNWNLVDSSAHLILGAHLFHGDCAVLYNLAQAAQWWRRRIAIVATWYFIRKSSLAVTFSLAHLLHTDPHDLVRKAVGWMLREAGKKDATRLLNFLLAYGQQMPKPMLRSAIERLSPTQKNLLHNKF